MGDKLSREIENYKAQRDMTKVIENRWLSNFCLLVDFGEKHGHVNVPSKYPELQSLGSWVCRQRLVYNRGEMDPLREHLLRSINFNFRLLTFHDWRKAYDKLIKLKKDFGRESSRKSNLMNDKLYRAIENYKARRNMSKIVENRWLAKFLLLVDFGEKHGHVNVPCRYPELQTLGCWVHRQRLVYHEGKIDPLREHLLRCINFNFRLLAIHDWDNMYNKLLDFKKRFGHVHITESYHDTQLHDWLVYQRKLYWRGKLEYSKIERLRGIGVDMRNKTMNMWNEKFFRLVQFKKEHGHLHVCKYFQADDQLINFVKVIRRSKDTISKERKEQLDKLGFIWDPGKQTVSIINKERAAQQWLLRFEELKEYKKRFGTTYILTTNKSYKSLANWALEQRNHFTGLPQERIVMLKEIGLFSDLQKHKESLKRKGEINDQLPVPRLV